MRSFTGGAVLTSEPFLVDKRFLGKVELEPNEETRRTLFPAVLRAQNLARLRLETADEVNALFALASPVIKSLPSMETGPSDQTR